MKINRTSLLLLFVSFLTFCLRVHASVVTWTNTGGGLWSAPSNWSPNQTPTSNDTVLITTPGTYLVALDVTNHILNLTVGGQTGSGSQTLLVTNLLAVASNTVVQGSGTLEITNSAGPFFSFGYVSVTDGGTLTEYANSSTYAFYFETTSVTVTNGGTINAIGFPSSFDSFLGISFPEPTIEGPILIAKGGTFNASGGTGALFTVGPGGTLNVNSELFTAVGTNQGTINITNADFAVGNFETQPSVPGFLNMPGGVINLSGTNYINAGKYFTNQGTVIQNLGSSTIYSATFYPSTGVVRNLQGQMMFQYVGTNLDGNFYSGADAAIVFEGADLNNTQTTNQIVINPNLQLRGPGQFELSGGYLYLATTVPTNLQLSPDTLTLAPNFQGGTVTNLSVLGGYLENLLPITGSFTLSNAGYAGDIVVEKGGVFDLYQAADPYIDQFQSLTINAGGTVNATNGSPLQGEYYNIMFATHWTNYGTLNLQDEPLTIFYGLLNARGATLNIIGESDIVLSATNTFFTNFGTIVQDSQTDVTNTISFLLNPSQSENFDTSRGNITNLYGTLRLESMAADTISGNYYANPGATIQFAGPTNGVMTLGGSLTLSGAGQHEFTSGTLLINYSIPANLSLSGGLIELAPGFQGGSITNLSLNGAALTNLSPGPTLVSGRLSVTNSGLVNGYASTNSLYGDFIVTNHGVIAASSSVFNGVLTLTNGGTLNCFQTIFNSNISVGAGSTINASLLSVFGTLSIESGATLNTVSVPNPPFGYFPGLIAYANVTNAGTINLTNASIQTYNGSFGIPTNTPSEICLNLPTGTIHLWGPSAITGSGNFVNEGHVISSSPQFSGFEIGAATNAGVIDAEAGPLLLSGNWTLTPSSVLSVALNGPTNYGSITITTNRGFAPEGSIALEGSFTATIGNGYEPVTGTAFNVLSYGVETGGFTTFTPPTAGKWSESYEATNLVLTVTGGSPGFSSPIRVGTNIVILGAGASPGGTFEILSSTNLALPLAKWTVLDTNTFSGSGEFSQTNAIGREKARFYIFKSLQ